MNALSMEQQSNALTPSSATGATRSNDNKVYNILLVGETGVGKSTLINSLMYYVYFPTLQEAVEETEIKALIPTKFTITDEDFNTQVIEFGAELKDIDRKNESFEPGASQTKQCRSYQFTSDGITIRLIDTPGIGDTSGIKSDETNFMRLAQFISEFEYLNAIVILLKPNESKVNVLFEYCIKQLLSSLEKSATENIVFLFTNARGTFYNPGDTTVPLKAILKDIATRPPNVIVPFTKKNTFCVDNEAFRYLLATRKQYKFNEKAKQSFVESWNVSADVCRNLLMYVVGLRPHRIQDTVSLMEARRTIERLRIPLAEIAQNIEDNIRRMTRLETKLSDTTKRLEDLAPDLVIKRINLQVNKLEYPMTVCADAACTEAHKIEDSTRIHYKTICHDHCYLDDVPREVRGDPRLQQCAAMTFSLLGTASCKRCKHSYQQHMHIYYTTSPYEEEQKNEKVEAQYMKKKIEREDIEIALMQCTKLKREYEKEREVIQKAVAKFAHFLKNCAILPYNDVYKKYIEYLIEREMNLGDLARQDVIKDYQELINMYEEEKKVLEEALTEAQKEDGTVKTAVSAAEVMSIKNQLYRLPLTGKTIKEMYEAQQTHVRHETYQRTEKIVQPTFTDKAKGKAREFYNWISGKKDSVQAPSRQIEKAYK